MFSVMEIATLLSGSYTGDGAIRVNFIRPIRSPDVGGTAIVFAKQDLQFLSGSHADVLIGPDEILDSPAKAHIVISHLDVERLNLFLRSYKVKKVSSQ